VDLELTADSVEFCPIPGFEELFVCGTYQLIKEINKKVGRLYLFSLQNRSEGSYGFVEEQRLDGGAILDLKWRAHITDNMALLAQADAGGIVTLLGIEKSANTLKSLTTLNVENEALCLSLDWSDRINKCNNPSIAVSLSNGHLAVCQVNQHSLSLERKWKGHDFEAWIAAFDYYSPTIYSGADDCTFKSWDYRTDCSKPIFSKSYDSGVTTIQCNPHQQFQVIVGSYDETITLWDIRNTKSAFQTIAMRGGVWRIKWHHSKKYLVLAACMRAGFQVVNLDKNEVVAKYRESCESLAYGADWYLTKDVIGTCSFYDRMMSLWTPSL